MSNLWKRSKSTKASTASANTLPASITTPNSVTITSSSISSGSITAAHTHAYPSFQCIACNSTPCACPQGGAGSGYYRWWSNNNNIVFTGGFTVSPLEFGYEVSDPHTGQMLACLDFRVDPIHAGDVYTITYSSAGTTPSNLQITEGDENNVKAVLIPHIQLSPAYEKYFMWVKQPIQLAPILLKVKVKTATPQELFMVVSDSTLLTGVDKIVPALTSCKLVVVDNLQAMELMSLEHSFRQGDNNGK